MPQIVLLTGRETLGKKAGKLVLREGEVYNEKKAGHVCIIFLNFFFYCLTIIYDNVSVFSG